MIDLDDIPVSLNAAFDAANYHAIWRGLIAAGVTALVVFGTLFLVATPRV